MNSENKDSTRKYLEENKYIFSLKRNTVLLHGEKKKKIGLHVNSSNFLQKSSQPTFIDKKLHKNIYQIQT